MCNYKEYIIFEKDSIRGYWFDAGNHKRISKISRRFKHIKSQ